jgi:glycosyltransferase involved in cell wall biosynthesis
MRKLLIFTTWQDGDEIDLKPTSNLWYIRRYESFFDEVTHVLLCGHFTQKEYRIGRSRYVSAGTGNHKLDLILAPLRLYKFAKEYRATDYSTDEQVWLFWVAFLIKFIRRGVIVLLPITYPEAMYKLTKRSLSRVLPIWLERKLLSLSYRITDRVVTSSNVGSYVDWMSANPILCEKLVVTQCLPESIPTEYFFNELSRAKEQRKERRTDESFKLIAVMRLHPEKAVDHLIRMMKVLKDRDVPVELNLIGDGDDRQRLEQMVSEMGLADRISFLGWKTNGELPHFLVDADAFVAPSAGGSLREAGLCGLPIIAYDLDWIHGLLRDGETFLAVTPDDYSAMADKVVQLMLDRSLRQRLALNIESFARDIWSDKNLKDEIQKIYRDL